MSGEKTFLVVDDERASCDSMADVIEEIGHRVYKATSSATAVEILQTRDIDILVTDLKMPGMDGMELLRYAKHYNPATVILLVTAYGTIESAISALKQGAVDYILKPLELNQFTGAIEKAINYHELLIQNIELRRQLQTLNPDEQIIGTSPPMQKIFELVELVAPTDSVVLLLGESGTGKELIAQAIHTRSPRASAPFIKVNCAALTETLLESELFGHEKGAFTGAYRQKKGKFELAHTGTILLDEVSELSPPTQAKLLRVLQEYAFERVGGTDTIKVDVRVIASTNADLAERVREGRFREDLYYRLSVVPITLPPLRDRREDIPPLVSFFLDFFGTKYNKPDLQMTPELLNALTSYHWPGNVRELRNCIERMVVTSRTNLLGIEYLPPEIRPEETCARPVSLVGSTLEEVEQRLIRETLEYVGGNRKRAAELLGIGLRTLQRRIKALGLKRRRDPQE